MRRFGLILSATALLATGVAGSAVAGGPAGSAHTVTAASSGASSSGLSPARSKAKKKAVAKCRKIKKQSRRRSCLKRVNKQFKPRKHRPRQVKPVAPGPIAATIDVRDKYFSPDVVNIKSGESILWVWSDLNKDAHNVDLTGGPVGVKRVDFSTVSSPSRGFEFRRTFTVPGQYNFACSIHHLMTMTVEVSK